MSKSALKRKTPSNSTNSEPELPHLKKRKDMKNVPVPFEGYKVISMDSDGNCLFRALQYELTGNVRGHDILRQHICDHIVANKASFRHFFKFHNITDDSFETYCQKVRADGVALSKL